jgi:hypothetical protein
MPGRHLIAIALFGAFSLLAVPAQSQSAGAKGAVDGDLISIESMREMFQNGDPGNKHFCAIVVTQPGSLAASPDNMELSSRQAGGRPGIAQITATNSSFDLTIDPPSGFNLAPSGGAEASGAFPMDIKRGVSQIEANFVATRNGSPFPAGQYSAELVLRCE